MSTARDYLAAVQQRADAATDWPWFGSGGGLHVYGREVGDLVGEFQRERDATFAKHSRTDVPRLVAALTAALDLAGGWMRSNDGHATPVERRRAKCGRAMEAVIADALTPKENDS